MLTPPSALPRGPKQALLVLLHPAVSFQEQSPGCSSYFTIAEDRPSDDPTMDVDLDQDVVMNAFDDSPPLSPLTNFSDESTPAEAPSPSMDVCGTHSPAGSRASSPTNSFSDHEHCTGVLGTEFPAKTRAVKWLKKFRAFLPFNSSSEKRRARSRPTLSETETLDVCTLWAELNGLALMVVCRTRNTLSSCLDSLPPVMMYLRTLRYLVGTTIRAVDPLKTSYGLFSSKTGVSSSKTGSLMSATSA